MRLDEISVIGPGERLDSFVTATMYSRFSPASSYLALRKLFGPPNNPVYPKDSFATGLPDDQQWSYLLRVPGGQIEIGDRLRTYVFVHIYSDSDDEEAAKNIGSDFIDFIGEEVKVFRKDVIAKADGTNRYVIPNPYRVYYDSASRLFEIASNEAMPPNPDPVRASFFLFWSALEGFVNLVYEIYLKPELRDAVISKKLSALNIDLKIQMAPVYCSCFSASLIEKSEEAFQQLSSIRELRNDLIHANVRQSSFLPVIEEDGYEFIIFRKSKRQYNLPNRIEDLSPVNIQFIKQAVDSTTNLIFRNMKPNDRHHFQRAVLQNSIELEYEDGETIVLRDQPAK